MMEELEQLPRDMLVRELRKRLALEARWESRAEEDPAALLRSLQIHQVELEMQNHELVEAQRALEESRGRYADLYNFAPVGICTLDVHGRVREINVTATTLLRGDREQLLGSSFANLVVMGERARFAAHLRRCFGEQKCVTSEVTLVTRGDRQLSVQLVSVPVRERGDIPTCRTALVDISDLKQSERRLRLLSDAGQKLASSLDYRHTLGAVVQLAVPLFTDLCMLDVLNDDGTIERLEATFADETKQAELGARLKQAHASGEASSLLQAVIDSGRSALFERWPPSCAESVGADESASLWALVAARSMIVVPVTARGHTLGALTFVIAESGRAYCQADVPFAEELARRAAMAIDNALLYDQAQKAVAARENLLAIVSHDLQNPLAVIMLRTGQMLDGAAAFECQAETRACFQSIQRASERMSALIEDLLDMAKIDAGRLSMHVAPLPLSALVAETLALFEPIADRRRIMLDGKYPEARHYVRCDRDRILQVLSNLIGNAVKFTAEGGVVEVVVSVGEGEVQVAVVDRGIGIGPDELPHVFDRFWTGARDQKLGTGLGLFISKAIIDAHGGRIWAESRPEGGTTLLFTLPLAGVGQEPAGRG